MADSISIVLTDDVAADLPDPPSGVPSFYFFNDGASPFWLARDGWQQAIASDGEETVDEVIVFNVIAEDMDTIAQHVRTVNRMLHRAHMYQHDEAEIRSLWLSVTADGETDGRTAMIVAVKHNAADLESLFARNTGAIAIPNLQIGLTRINAWEDGGGFNVNTGAIDLISAGPVSIGTVVGDIPARIARLVVNGVSGGGGPISQVWCGFRSDRFADPTQFEHLWECELGFNDNGSGFDTISGASGGAPNVVSVAPAATLTAYLRLSVSDLVGAGQGQRGRFVVLLRASVSDATTACNVRLSDGMREASQWNARQRVRISGTAWRLYEMGVVQIPTPGHIVNFNTADQIDMYTLRIEAETAAGSGNLYLDCFVLIPIAEGFVYCENAAVQYTTESLPAIIQQRADGHIGAVWANTFGMVREIPAHVQGGPVGPTYVVLAGQRSTGSVLGDDLSLSIRLHQRWRTLRGNQ